MPVKPVFRCFGLISHVCKLFICLHVEIWQFSGNDEDKINCFTPYACAGGNKTNHDLSEKKGESLLGLIHSWSHFMCIRLSEMFLLDICIICICRNSNMIPFTLNLNAVVACI